MKVWVVIDEGCQECGVESLPLGIFLTEEKAEAVRAASPTSVNNWRDGGQAGVCIYEMELPQQSGVSGAAAV